MYAIYTRTYIFTSESRFINISSQNLFLFVFLCISPTISPDRIRPSAYMHTDILHASYRPCPNQLGFRSCTAGSSETDGFRRSLIARVVHGPKPILPREPGPKSYVKRPLFASGLQPNRLVADRTTCIFFPSPLSINCVLTLLAQWHSMRFRNCMKRWQSSSLQAVGFSEDELLIATFVFLTRPSIVLLMPWLNMKT